MLYTDYIPSTFEYIGDVLERSTRAKDLVQLLFLVKNGADIENRQIPKTFAVSLKLYYNTKRQTMDVEYKIYDMELQMDLFLLPKDIVLSYFAGDKITCATKVSLND